MTSSTVSSGGTSTSGSSASAGSGAAAAVAIGGASAPGRGGAGSSSGSTLMIGAPAMAAATIDSNALSPASSRSELMPSTAAATRNKVRDSAAYVVAAEPNRPSVDSRSSRTSEGRRRKRSASSTESISMPVHAGSPTSRRPSIITIAPISRCPSRRATWRAWLVLSPPAPRAAHASSRDSRSS